MLKEITSPTDLVLNLLLPSLSSVGNSLGTPDEVHYMPGDAPQYLRFSARYGEHYDIFLFWPSTKFDKYLNQEWCVAIVSDRFPGADGSGAIALDGESIQLLDEAPLSPVLQLEYFDVLYALQGFARLHSERLRWLVSQRTSAMHQMTSSLDRGQKAEQFLDEWFSQHYSVIPVSKELQAHEIDRIFDRGEIRIFVEYKADWMASKTGNAFVELDSRYQSFTKKGWAEASRATVLVYYLPEDGLFYWIPMAILRAKLPEWRSQCKQRTISTHDKRTGQTWQTDGLLVPLAELEAIAQRVVNL